MIDDMASLKQAMELMDASDAAVAQAAKDRAARLLSDAKLSFAKMAELIEERRLLLRPAILAGIKRMDEPDTLGDAAFHETSSSLRGEGQSFRQIAEALELNGATPLRYEATTQRGRLPHRTGDLPQPIQMESEPAAPEWVFYPLRHPIRFLVIALLAFMLFNTVRGVILLNTVRGFAGIGRLLSGHVADGGAAGQHAEAPPSSATPPAGPATASNPPASAPAPTTTAPAPITNDGGPPLVSTPRLGAKGAAPPNSPANDRLRMVPRRAVEDEMPAGFRRNSRLAGPCIGGTGGCFWGGGRY